MKRAKVMLTGIAILAVVGGALAFKAKNSDFCVLESSGGTGTCTASFHGKITTATGATSYYTAAIATDCTTQTCNGTAVKLTTAE